MLRRFFTHLSFFTCLLFVLAGSAARADHAADLRAVLATIRLPPGFHISLYALAPDARALALSPDGKTLIVGTMGDSVHRVSVGAETAAKVEAFAPGAGFVMPNGPCFAPDGDVFIAEFNRIRRFTHRPDGWDATLPHDIVAPGALIPPSEISHVHGARVCRVGPDGKLYVTIGQPDNVPTPARNSFYEKAGMGAIIRMNSDGGNREVYASGIRNSVGLDFDPRDGTLWFTDNQADWMGDDIPPGEINRATKPGQNFGFPYYGGGSVRTKPYAAMTPPGDVVFPMVEEVAHAADLGMIFYRGAQFPMEWRGIFSAQHGSWNRSTPVGGRVMFTPLRADGAGPSIPFAEGWNIGKRHYLGRPVDVVELRDGSLIVSDDQEGALYRIFYDGK
jgi:glucose/arabinose dehydrogenase